MSTKKIQYACQACGAIAAKWSGQCSACKAWNTLEEEIASASVLSSIGRSSGRGRSPLSIDAIPPTVESVLEQGEGKNVHLRLSSGFGEFDRVCGAGGMVPGSVILIGGDPGIGKSTLLLQIAGAISAKGRKVLYVSGEEAIHQVAMRAQRLQLEKSSLHLLSTNEAEEAFDLIEAMPELAFVVVDSIQTLASRGTEAPIGSVNQMRLVTQELVRLAKTRSIALVIVGHVTKDGQLAGPKLVEHMVDSVFYFEGDNKGQFRILRAVKNRFGATNEIGVFEMDEKGLIGIENASKLFLADHQEGVPGSAILASMEGTRPILIEVQTLLAKSNLAVPRRVVSGVEVSKLSMIIAVLETKCGLKLSYFDIYLNIAGGLKVLEPAADLAIAASVLSSYFKVAVPPKSVFFGEIGLSGSIRSVSALNFRIKEAEKMGFERVFLPKSSPSNELLPTSLKLSRVESLYDLVKIMK